MKLAIIGTVGVPGRYGGFETLAQNLVDFHARTNRSDLVTVWCSKKDSTIIQDNYKSATLRYVNLRANGAQSMLYDSISLFQAVLSKHDVILLLGVSGALALPFLKLVSSVRIVTNIDGLEWKRQKWKPWVRFILRISEWAAVRFSDEVIADNRAIADYVWESYSINSHVIAYGGDHALENSTCATSIGSLPSGYALALCRIEPENNVHLILEAFVGLNFPLVFVGNWENSEYGKALFSKYSKEPNFSLLLPIYDAPQLFRIRAGASIYLHGHSAGGTNPSLVEMMHFGIPILAYSCEFNWHTTFGCSKYFSTSDELRKKIVSLQPLEGEQVGAKMKEIAMGEYTWEKVGSAYFDLFQSGLSSD